MKDICYGIDKDRDFLVLTRSVRGMRETRHTLVYAGAAPGAELRARIQAELENRKAVLAAALPVEATLLRRLTAPFPSLRKARRILPSLLDVQLPFPIEDCVARYPAVLRTGSRVQALAVAARRETVREHLRSLKTQGWDPIVLDHEGLALWTQSLYEKPCAPGARRVVAYIGRQRVVLVWGTAALPEGAHSCRREAEGPENNRTEASRLADKLRQALHPLLQSGPDTEWWWCGPGAETAAFLQALEQAIGLASKQCGHVHETAAGFLARAVAQRWLDGAARAIDFRWPLEPHPQRMRLERRRQQGRLRLLLAAMLAAGIGLGSWMGLLRQRERQWTHALRELSAELAPGWSIAPHQEILLVGRALEEQRQQAAPYLRLYAPGVALRLNELLQQAAAQGILLDALEMGPEQVVLSGRAASPADWAALGAILTAGGYTMAPPEASPCEETGAHLFRQRGQRAP